MRAAALLAALLALLAAGPARAGPPDGIVPPVWDASLAYRAGAAGGACLLVVAALIVAVRRSALRGGCLHRALQRLDDDAVPTDADADNDTVSLDAAVPATLPQPVGKAVAAPQAARPVLLEAQTAPIALTPEVREVRRRVALLGYAAACLMAFVVGALCVLAGELLSGPDWLIWRGTNSDDVARYYFRDHPWVDVRCPDLLLDIDSDAPADLFTGGGITAVVIIALTAPIFFFTLAMMEKVVVGLMLELDVGRWRGRWGFVVRRRNSNYGTASRVCLFVGAFLCMDPIFGLETPCETEGLKTGASIYAAGNVAIFAAALSLLVQHLRPGCTSGCPTCVARLASGIAYLVVLMMVIASLIEFPPSATFSIPRFSNEPGVISTLKVANLATFFVDVASMLLVSRGAGGDAFERSTSSAAARGAGAALPAPTSSSSSSLQMSAQK